MTSLITFCLVIECSTSVSLYVADKGTGRSALLFNNAIKTQHSGYAKVAVVYLYIVVV